MKRLSNDGIYTNDLATKTKFTDPNLQRVEERLINEGHKDFFKMNGELKLDYDMQGWEITRPLDLYQNQYQTKVRSASACDRKLGQKRRFFHLYITVGKIVLRDHPLFKDEDRLAVELKDMHEEFERRTALGMIGFYRTRLLNLKKELKQARKEKKRKDSD